MNNSVFHKNAEESIGVQQERFMIIKTSVILCAYIFRDCVYDGFWTCYLKKFFSDIANIYFFNTR